jgi:hypothetical protein
MLLFHRAFTGAQAPQRDVPDDPPERLDAGEFRVAGFVLAVVAALLIWSVASRPWQFFASGADGARHCVYLGRAGASCGADAHPEPSPPRR